jgi:glycosyltransferase involved in cell wall biosynthesis
MPTIGGDRPIRVVQLITTLARGGAQATVVASSNPADPDVEVMVLAGTDTTGEGTLWGDPAVAGLALEPVPHLVRPLRPVQDLRALLWLVRRLRADQPDVLHTHSSKAGVLGRLAAAVAGVPCVHTVHGWGPLHGGTGPIARVARLVDRGLARLSGALVVVGQGDLDLGLGHRIGRPDQYRLIRSGVELAEVGDADARAAVRADLALGDRWVVGMVGRFARQKDQATLIEAFDRAGLGDDATLVLVGDGPRRPALEPLVADRPHLDIRLLGARPDGARIVAGFDVAVNAAHWEGLPRTVVEAAAAGVPVVASDVGSTRELIESGRSGWLVPPADPDVLAAALVEVRRRPARAAILAAEARRRSEAFSADRMRRELVGLWRELAGRTTGQHRPRSSGPARPGAGFRRAAPRRRVSPGDGPPT